MTRYSASFMASPKAEQLDPDAKVSEDEQLRATRLVCSRANNVTEAREMLAMLGLLPEPKDTDE